MHTDGRGWGEGDIPSTVEQIVPEIHANIRLAAQQEVEIASLREEIAAARQALAAERGRLAQLFAFSGMTYTRDPVKTELVRRPEMTEEAEVVLAGNLASVEALIQAGANVNAVAGEPGYILLHCSPSDLAMQCHTL